MTRPQLIINLHGGLVRDVFSSVPDIQVLVIDWDVEGAFPDEPGLVELQLDDGLAQACVSDVSVDSLHDLAGTDIEAAIEAAQAQGVLCDHDKSCCT